MLQSVHTVRWLLHALALLLAVCAVANPASWNVIHVPARAAVADSSAIRSSSASIGNRSALALPDAARVPQAAAYVTFAPGHYCVVREHTRECHEYAHLLKSIGSDASSSSRHRSAKDRAQVAIHAATEQDIAQVYTDATDRVVMSWCRIQSEGSWFVQGAQSMGCLVVLETCLYTMVFWVLFSGLAALFALTSSLWPVAFTKLEPATAFCSYLAALLGVFLVVEWWGYSTYFIDKPYLQSQALVWHYGTAFKLVCVSVLLSLVAARITLHLAIRVRANYAQLHSTPPELSPTSSTAVNDSPIAVQRDECDDTNVDPLQSLKVGSCTTACTKEMARVCGSNGVTYDNPCLLKNAQCANATLTQVASTACGSSTPKSAAVSIVYSVSALASACALVLSMAL